MRATKRYRLVHFYSGLRASTVSDWFWFFLSLALPPNRRIGIFVFYLWLFTPLWRLFIFFSSSKFRVERPASTFFMSFSSLEACGLNSLLIPVPLLLFSYLIPHTVSKIKKIFTHQLFPILKILAWFACDIPPQFCIHIQHLALAWQYSWLGAFLQHKYTIHSLFVLVYVLYVFEVSNLKQCCNSIPSKNRISQQKDTFTCQVKALCLEHAQRSRSPFTTL